MEMDETTAIAARKAMYDQMLITEEDRIVNWDFDPLDRGLRDYVDMACGCDGPYAGIWTPQFEYRYCTGKIKAPFTKTDYRNNEDIIGTVRGLGLEVEKFWFALVFIYDYVETSFIDCILPKPASLGRAMQELFQALGEDCTDGEIDILIKKGKRNIEVLPVIKRAMLDWLRETYEENYKDVEIRSYRAETTDSGLDFINSSYRIYRTAQMYKELFNELLGDKRPQSVDKSISLNRQLLVSRICYLYKFTQNSSFLYADDSLKGILKAYKGRVPPTQPSVYL